MSTQWRRFAPIGLYLSLLALIAAAGLYIVQREWNLPLQLSLGLVIIGLALFAVLDPERVRIALTGRQARYGSNALVMSLAFIGIVVVVNYLVYKYPKRWDLTEDKTNTLNQATLDTLKKLPAPVQAQAFFTSATSTDTAKKLLDNYKYYSNGKFSYKFIDPNSDPVAAKAANVTSDGTIVLAMNGRVEKVTIADETDMDGALIRLMSQKVSVYFLTGHSELSPDDTGDQSLTDAKDALQKKNYTIQTLNLLGTSKIPDDAKVIVIAGPKKPVTDNEMKLISDWVVKGGSLIVMEEPTIVTDYGDVADPLANYLSSTWGILLRNDVVLDFATQQPYQAMAAEYGNHPITEKLQRLGTAFLTARSVTASNPAPSGITLTELIKTASQPQSWAETDLAGLKAGTNPQPDPSKDLMGPVSLAVAAEKSTPRTRVVVFGDADFASNVGFNFLGDGDLLANSIDWATEQENLINLTANPPTQRIMLQPQRYTMNLLLLGSVFVLPGMVVVAGVFAYVQRRKRG